MDFDVSFSSGSSEDFIDETVVQPDRILEPYQFEPVFTSAEIERRATVTVFQWQ
jgi:hypothetical protein